MDPRETLAELTAKAHEISQHAGTKVGAAMKDVIGAAAGLTGFAVESARDLIQYMVRRGQMTQTEGDKLLREVEAAHPTKRAATRSLEDSARTASQRSQPQAPSIKAPAAKPAPRPTSKAEPAPVKAAKTEAGPVKTAAKTVAGPV
jgi:polyhydroxyalkanoate synthesis regulator phasin